MSLFAVARQTFRRLIAFMGPRWLVKDEVVINGVPKEADSRILYPVMLMLDAYSERVRQGARSALPGLAPEDALPFIGKELDIIRGPAEPRESYEARLIRGIDDKRVAGLAWALLEQIRGYCTPHKVRVRLVNEHGHWYSIDRDGTRTRNRSTVWEWDNAYPKARGTTGALLPWSRYWVLIYPTCQSFNQNRFDFSTWTLSETSISATGLADSDGGLKATRIYDNAQNQQHRIDGSIKDFVTGTYTVSVLAKASGVRYLWLDIGGTYRVFDLQDGDLGASGSATATIVPADVNGFYKCTITVTGASSTVKIGMSTADSNAAYVGTGAQGVILYKPLVESAASPRMPWDRDGVWGDGAVWGDSGGTWGSNASAADVAAIRNIVSRWRPTSRCVSILVVFDDDALKPTDTALPLPDGSWQSDGKYVASIPGRKVNARHVDAIYWAGTSPGSGML